MTQAIDNIYGASRYNKTRIQEFHTHLHNFIFNKQDENLWKSIDIKPYQFDPYDDIMYNANISIKNDRLIRICCLNHKLNRPVAGDTICDNEQLYQYLHKQTTNAKLFTQVAVKDLKKQCKTSLRSSNNNVTARILFKLNERIEELQNKFDQLPDGNTSTCLNYEHVYCIAKLIWFLSPLFVFSRIFYFIFPIISLIEEFNYFLNDDNDESLSESINDIVLFQVVLFGCYYCLVIVWFVNFVNVCNFYYWTKLVGIGSKKWNMTANSVRIDSPKSKFWKPIIEKYNKMIDDIAIQEILCEYLGNDIASIVFEYYIQISDN